MDVGVLTGRDCRFFKLIYEGVVIDFGEMC